MSVSSIVVLILLVNAMAVNSLQFNNLQEVNEMSYRLRELTSETTIRREIAILLLPCPALLADRHLEEFLIKLLKHANVDYELTRVSMW